MSTTTNLFIMRLVNNVCIWWAVMTMWIKLKSYITLLHKGASSQRWLKPEWITWLKSSARLRYKSESTLYVEMAREKNGCPYIAIASNVLKLNLCISIYTAIKQKTKSCTYVGLYGSAWLVYYTLTSYVSTIPTLFACFLGYDISKSSFICIEFFLYES